MSVLEDKQIKSTHIILLRICNVARRERVISFPLLRLGQVPIKIIDSPQTSAEVRPSFEKTCPTLSRFFIGLDVIQIMT